MRIRRKIGQASEWYILLALEYAYARGILAGIVSYVDAHPEIVLSVGNRAGLAAILEKGESPVITMLGHPTYELARKSRAPVVNVSGLIRTPEIMQVVPRNHQAGQLAAAHLTGLGYRRLLFVGGRFWYGSERRRGFVEEAERVGAAVRQVHDFDVSDIMNWELPLGVFASGDTRARDVIKQCRIAGIRVPADVAVVGCDNDPTYAEMMTPQLTSVELGTRKVGFAAARALRQMLAGEKPKRLLLEMEVDGVVARESTSTVAVASPTLAAAMQIMTRDATTGITVQEVAATLGVSRSYVTKLCREHLGMSAKEYLTKAKLDAVKKLLEETDRKISDIAEACGFRHYPRFNALFRKVVGMPPGKYRSIRRLK